MYSHNPAPPSHPSSSTRQKHQREPPPPITIAVMGATGSGKTTFINMASGSDLRIGSSLESCTAEVQLANEFTIDRQPIVLIDTPGFDDTNKSDTDILKLIASFLATTYKAGSKLAGVIYIHRISDYRFTGISGRNFKMFRELCGESSLKNVILVTNMWGEVTKDVGESRERQLITNFFKPVLDKNAQIARHYNTIDSAHDIIRCIMKNQPIPLQIQIEIVDEHKDIIDTAAGDAVNKELNEQMRRHQRELKSIQEDMAKALKEKDEETRKELEEATQKLHEEINKRKAESEGLMSNLQEENKRMEKMMKDMQENARLEKERSEAAYKEQMAGLQQQLAESSKVSAARREEMENQIKNLQHQWDNRPRGGGGCLIM